MTDNLILPNIRLFVFGTLRKGGRLDYYMEGTNSLGLFYTKGQLMKSVNGSAYVDLKDVRAATIGELYHVNFYCLQRINHLESRSGEFPTGYDLSIIPIWSYYKNRNFTFCEDKKLIALYYRRRNKPMKVLGGDWINRKKPMQAIENFLTNENKKTLHHRDVTNFMVEYLNL